MREDAYCPELERIRDFIDQEDPVPQDFILHAQTCEVCLFWLSYGLALEEAFCTTTRLFFNDAICLDKSAFQMLLHRTICDRQFHPLIAEEEIKKKTASREEERLAEIWSHLCGCDPCNDYYQTLYLTAAAMRKKYVMRIQRGGAITPCTEYIAREIPFSAIKNILLDYEPDKTKKPS